MAAPGNDLMRRIPGGRPPQMAPQPQQQEGGDPMLDEFTKRAQAAGVDINGEIQKGGDPQEVLSRAIQQIWKAQPTDDNAEMIEMLSERMGLPTPWGKPGEPPQQQMAPQQRPAMPPAGPPPNNMLMPRR